MAGLLHFRACARSAPAAGERRSRTHGIARASRGAVPENRARLSLRTPRRTRQYGVSGDPPSSGSMVRAADVARRAVAQYAGDRPRRRRGRESGRRALHRRLRRSSGEHLRRLAIQHHRPHRRPCPAAAARHGQPRRRGARARGFPRRVDARGDGAAEVRSPRAVHARPRHRRLHGGASRSRSPSGS